MSILSELRRRKVFRVAATYVIASWLIIQVVSAVDAPLSLPAWFDTVVIVLLAIGFPIAVLFAWAFELTPDGIRTTRPEASGEAGRPGDKLDYALIGALIIVAGAMAWNQVGAPDAVSTSARAPVPGDKSIAVLPFTDMSPAGSQGYFADGISEELLNELTRLEGLRVASRTSSFAFRDGDADVRAIGEALNVSFVLEGSVRTDGDRIRITAQLVDTADGYHHWSQTYDRDLQDILVLQEQIAGAIASHLGVRLGVGNVNSFQGAGTDSVDAYLAYLQASAMPMGTDDHRRALERALAIDPDYTAALAAMGISIASTMWANRPEEAPAILSRALQFLNRAIELRPDSAYAHALHATANYASLDWGLSEQHYQEALAISRNGGTLSNYGNMLMRAGRSEAAIRSYAEAADAERYPFSGSGLSQNAYLAMGLYSETSEYVAQLPVGSLLGFLLALNQGDAQALEAELGAWPKSSFQFTELFSPLLEVLDSPGEALVLLRSVHANTDVVWPSKYHDIALLAAYYGDPEFALSVFAVEARLTTVRYGAFWYPVMSEVRQLPAFQDLMRDVNLLEYWQEYGWSTHCRSLGEQDFECF